jgi:hypothetical protein
MKSVTLELRYPGRTVEEVRAMLADPDFRQAVCSFQQVEDSAVTIEEFDDGSMTVDLDRTYGTDLVPSFARKFVGDTISLVQREEWSSPTESRFEVSIPGKPGDLTGTARLVQSGPDAVETVAMEVKVIVDAGTNVVVSGVPIMGEFHQAKDKVAPSLGPEAPIVRVKGMALMGSVSVQRLPPPGTPKKILGTY